MAVATPVCGGVRRHKPNRAPVVAAGVATASRFQRDKSRRGKLKFRINAVSTSLLASRQGRYGDQGGK